MMVLKGSGHTRKHRACVGVYGGLPFYMVLKGFAGFSGVSTMGFLGSTGLRKSASVYGLRAPGV